MYAYLIKDLYSKYIKSSYQLITIKNNLIKTEVLKKHFTKEILE